MTMKPLDEVSISGGVLASIMEHLVSGTCDSDGLLFGTFSERSSLSLTDKDDERASKEECFASITGYCVTGSLFSFYDASGSIQTDKLSRLIESRKSNERVIGWFVIRRNVPLIPSMREKFVNARLQGLPHPWNSPFLLSSSPPASTSLNAPLLFCIFGAFTDPSFCIHTYDYKMFYSLPSRPTLLPLPLTISNIGPAFRANYDSFVPSAKFPTLPYSFDSSIPYSDSSLSTNEIRSTDVSRSKSESKPNLYARDSSTKQNFNDADLAGYMEGLVLQNEPQVRRMEEMYSLMLQRLENLVQEVGESSLELQNNKRTNSQLKQILDGQFLG